MVVTTGGFQSCRWVTSGISKVRKYPSTEPEPPARIRAERMIKAMFLRFRQKGTRGGGPDGVPPRGLPPDGLAPDGPNPVVGVPEGPLSSRGNEPHAVGNAA